MPQKHGLWWALILKNWNAFICMNHAFSRLGRNWIFLLMFLHPCSQILTKHNNEARVLQGLLRETRSCRDNLARQLQATENKLLSTKASLQHLQLLSQDRSLLEREELTLRLTRATAELGEKGKRIVVWRSRRGGMVVESRVTSSRAPSSTHDHSLKK